MLALLSDICTKFYVNAISYLVTLVFSKWLITIWVILTMADFVEQRSTIKFCLQYDISAAKMFRNNSEGMQ